MRAPALEVRSAAVLTALQKACRPASTTSREVSEAKVKKKLICELPEHLIEQEGYLGIADRLHLEN
jgi:hypothetical protein